MNSAEQQALFEIVMAVGNGMELHPMLQTSLSVMMRKLGCNMAVVVRCDGNDVAAVHSIPHHIKQSREILAICHDFNNKQCSLPQLIEVGPQTFMLFVLAGYGLLVLGKTGAALSKSLRGSLTLIANKLALACTACEQAQAIKRAQRHTQLLLNSTAEGIYGVDIHGNCTFANAAFLQIFGYSDASEIIGKPVQDMIFHGHSSEIIAAKQEALLLSPMQYTKKTHASDEVFWRRDGSSFPVEYWSYPIEEEGVVTGAVVTFFDITERKAAEEQIKNLAFYDPLTLLPNRRLLLDRLQRALVSSIRNGRKVALLFLDLDNFKTLNDTLGHDKGDMLLQQVAHRLTTCIREGDTAARFGGDEFLVMLEGLSLEADEAMAQVEFIGNKILTMLNQPYDLDGTIYYNTPSIGMTLFNDEHCSVDELMKRADIAMYQAKADGRNTLRFFDRDVQNTDTDNDRVLE